MNRIIEEIVTINTYAGLIGVFDINRYIDAHKKSTDTMNVIPAHHIISHVKVQHGGVNRPQLQTWGSPQAATSDMGD